MSKTAGAVAENGLPVGTFAVKLENNYEEVERLLVSKGLRLQDEEESNLYDYIIVNNTFEQDECINPKHYSYAGINEDFKEGVYTLPAIEVIASSFPSTHKRIVLVGKAGSGKDYFRDYLSQVETLDVSYTTRPARDGEKDGYTYNYITEEEFLEKKANGFFLEAVNFNGWWYGTSNSNWNSKRVFIMTPSGTTHIPEKDIKDCILVYFDIPLDTRRERLSKRSDADSVDRRITADEKDFAGFDRFNIRVTNPLFNAGQLHSVILNYASI